MVRVIREKNEMSQAVIPLKWQPLGQRLPGPINLPQGLEQSQRGVDTGCALSVASSGPAL